MQNHQTNREFVTNKKSFKLCIERILSKVTILIPKAFAFEMTALPLLRCLCKRAINKI